MADIQIENHISCTQICSQTFFVRQIIHVGNAVAMLPGSNATVFYCIWLIVDLSLLAHCRSRHVASKPDSAEKHCVCLSGLGRCKKMIFFIRIARKTLHISRF